MSLIQLHQQLNNNNNNYYYWQLIAILDVNENGRLIFPFSRRLILIDRPFENQNENHNDEQNETSSGSDNKESEFSSSSLTEDYFITDDENNDDNTQDNGSFRSISSPPTPFDYDPFDSYDWEC